MARKQIRWKCGLLCLTLFFCLGLASCKGIEITGKTEEVEEYTRAEVMVLLGSERNRYQQIFGPELWSLPIEGQQEDTYGAYFVQKTKEYLQDIKTLNLLAAERGIIASAKDKDEIRTAASAFYEGLTEEDKAFFGDCTIKDVTNIYTEYFVASKTAEYLLSAVDFEVSDADAKVITVQQIEVSEQATAEDLYEKVNVSGANFAYYARQYSESPEIERVLAVGVEDNAYYRTAFSLEKGEISPVISQDGKYYLLKCLDAYDREATRARKEQLEQAIRTSALTKSYEEYASQHIVRFRDPFWREIDLTSHPDSQASDFFSLYEEYFG